MAVTKIYKKTKGKKFTESQLKVIERFMKMNDEELSEHLPDSTRYDPSHRLSDSERHSRLVMMHRLLLRRIPMREIANQLGVSERMGYILKNELREYAIREMSLVKWEGFIAETLMFYEEMRASALLISSSTGATPSHKVQAILAALASERNKHEFMTRLGVFGDHTGKMAAQSAFLPVENEEAHHDNVAMDALSMISAEMKKMGGGNLIDGELESAY